MQPAARRTTLAELKQAFAASPGDAARANRLGKALIDRDETAAGLELLERAAEIDAPRYAYDLAETLTRLRKWSDAAISWRKEVSSPQPATRFARLGWVCENLDDYDGAQLAYAQATALSPGSVDGYVGLARVCIRGSSAMEAEVRLRKLAHDGLNERLIFVGLGKALADLGRYVEAITYYTRALAISPQAPEPLLCIGRASLALGDLDCARRHFRQALVQYPDNVWACLDQLFFLIRTGSLAEARQLLQTGRTQRLLQMGALKSHPEVAPQWDGRQKLSGKTVFVENRGGFGDALQFSRFASLLKRRGASRVIVQCQPALQKLLMSLPEIDEVVAPYDQCSLFHYQCRPDYAGFLMEWSWESLWPSPPYLKVGEPLAFPHEKSGSNHLRVGVAWSTSSTELENPYTFRSIPPSALEPLSALDGVAVFGLQYGVKDSEAPAWLAANLGPGFRDFEDAAAAALDMDVVITIDTALAHLAGALGKRCYLLLPVFTCWRWMTDSASATGDCPWYPQMRIFRQTRPGDWPGVIKAAAKQLQKDASAFRFQRG